MTLQPGLFDPEVDHLGMVVARQWGDFYLQLHLIEATYQMLRPKRFTLFASSFVAPILAENPWGAEVLTFDPFWARYPWGRQDDPGTDDQIRRSIDQFLGELKGLELDPLIIADVDPRLSACIDGAGIPTTVGFASPELPNTLTHAYPFPTSGHQSVRFHSLATSFAQEEGLDCPPWQPATWLIDPDSSNARFVDRLIESLGLADQPLIGFQPCASYPSKNGEPKLWGHLFDHTLSIGHHPVIIGGPKDRFEDGEGRKLLSQIGCTLDLRGKLTLPQTQHLLYKLKLLVGVDSGGGHSKAALITKKEIAQRKLPQGQVISLFSSTNDPSRWGVVSINPGNVRTFCIPPKNRKNHPMGETQLPPGTIRNPYMDIKPHWVTDAIDVMLGLQ